MVKTTEINNFYRYGAPALSHFRIERLLAQICYIVPQINNLYAEFIHFIHADEKLTPDEDAILSNLLDYGHLKDGTFDEAAVNEFRQSEHCLLVIPKAGTISAWSSKATEIFHQCGLHKIKRVERGIAYYLDVTEKLTWGDIQAISDIIHDPKIETVVSSMEKAEKGLFQDELPKLLSEIPLLNQGKSEFFVSNLEIPGFLQPWEEPYSGPKLLASSLDIMLEAPMATARFKNEAGRPTLTGFFRTFEQSALALPEFDVEALPIAEIVSRLLHLPAIADKSFLIHINDRTVTGLVVRDQMVGPWQVAVADSAVTARDYQNYQGEAMSIGERPLLAIMHPEASARMAVGEAITNLASACIGALSDIRLSVHCGTIAKSLDEKQSLYRAIQALGQELSPKINITFTESEDALPVVITAFAHVMDVRRSLTPLLNLEGDTQLILIDLSAGQKRLGGSALAQVYKAHCSNCPDLDHPELLKGFFSVIQQLNVEDKILAYHDRSDGGLFVTLCEMAFAAHTGLQIDLTALGTQPNAILFNEELAAVIQVKNQDVENILLQLKDAGLTDCFSIGIPDESDRITFIHEDQVIFTDERIHLHKIWSETSYHLQALRDNPRTAAKQFETLNDKEDPGLNAKFSFDLSQNIAAPYVNVNVKPKIAILREQGINAYKEMAAAFHNAGFLAIDVQMNDLHSGALKLSEMKGLAVCGGFSYGDVLGAGQGWAKRILFNENLKQEFSNFFQRKDTFTLGVCNGGQMLSGLRSIIPGTELWPEFLKNYSEQFEGRLSMVEVEASPSIFLQGMQGSIIPMAVAHGEGRAEFRNEEAQDLALKQHLITLRYVDSRGRKTNIYPANPNGSALGVTGLTTPDGRINIMIPHPERGFRTLQYSWHPKGWPEDGPWMRIFRNARVWVD